MLIADSFTGTFCQTRIGIGVTQRISHLAIGLILESEVTVIVDQYQCVKAYKSKYLRSIGDLKFFRKSGLALVLCCTYMLLLYVSVCTYLHLFTNQALSKSIAC